MTTARLYLAGPMTGLPDYNYPAFHAAAKVLRDQGLEVLNPAENPAPPCGTWAAYMRMAIAQLVQCDGIVLLPGWADSKGALIERKLAQVLGMTVSHFASSHAPNNPVPLDARPEPAMLPDIRTRWAKVTEARYAAAIPPCCAYQGIDQHLNQLMLCQRLLHRLENDQPMDCTDCAMALPVWPTSTQTAPALPS